jgi:cytidyltransferase-like protein
MIVELDDLKTLRDMRTVYMGGVFDLTHAGHFHAIRFLKEKYPDYLLVVGVMGSERVRKLKGEGRPILSAEERLAMIDGNKYVDYCFIYRDSELNPPHFHTVPEILSADVYATERARDLSDKFFSESGIKIEFLKRKGELSTTEIINRIIRK